MPGRSIRIFLPDGAPTGLRVTELGLSTIKCVVSPRSMLPALAERAEANKTGLYFLVGPDEENWAQSCVYVGEGDEVIKRLRIHNSDEQKDFWDTAFVFISKGDDLTKAHVRWLEARSVQDLRSAKRARVLNGTTPEGGALPESDAAEMEEFLEQVKLLLPALGFTGFEPVVAQPSTVSPIQSVQERILFQMNGDGYNAEGYESEGNFVVRSGALLRAETAESISASCRNLRRALTESDAIIETDGELRLTKDYSFDSPSQAAGVICGFSINGRNAWRTPSDQTLAEVQDQNLEAASSEG